MPDRRAVPRYALSMPISVRVHGLDPVSSHVGRILDVSTRGVQVTLERAISVGTPLDFTITLQPEHGHPADAFIHGSGRVARVARCGENQFRVSIAVNRFQISREEAS